MSLCLYNGMNPFIVVSLAWNFISTVDTPILEELPDTKKFTSAEEELRKLVNNIPVMAWLTRIDGYVYWYNAQWFKYTGTTAEQMKGRAWESVPHPDYLDELLAKWQMSLDTGQVFEAEFPMRSASGEYRMFLNKAVPYRDDNGTILYWLGTNTDINKVHEREIALSSSLSELKELTKSLTDKGSL